MQCARLTLKSIKAILRVFLYLAKYVLFNVNLKVVIIVLSKWDSHKNIIFNVAAVSTKFRHLIDFVIYIIFISIGIF